MISCGAVGHVFFAVQGYQFLLAEFSAAASLHAFWSSWGPFTIFWLFSFLQLAGEWFLVYGQIRGAAADLTTWEQMGLMQHGERPHIYDRGVVNNLKQFFKLAGKDQIDYESKWEGEIFEFEPVDMFSP